MKVLLLSFIPLFVAVDAIGTLPIFMTLTAELSNREKRGIIFQSVITALCVAIGFIFLGKALFRFLGISVGDFMVAGGAILFCIAIIDIVNPYKRRRLPGKTLGVVPLGTPLIVGPAVLTTSLIVIGQYGVYATLIAVAVNVLLAGLVFAGSTVLMKVLGDAGTQACSKVTSLLLAAIAVMMMRQGITELLSGSLS
jgi:multiple antibiotic resistance protein